MSPIAKIFSVVNLVLAGLFLGWAANALSTNAEFKSKYDAEVAAHKVDKDALGADKSALVTKLQQSENDGQALKSLKEEAERKLAAVQADLESERTRNGSMNANLTTLTAQFGQVEENRNKLQADKDKAQQASHDAEGAKSAAIAKQLEAEKKLSDTETELNKSKNQVADLEKANTTLDKEKKNVDTQLASALAMTNLKVSDITSQPLIEGKVLDVSMSIEPGLVAINKGEADGVRRGFTFELYDGKTYKGQARVEYVHPNSCSAIMVRAVKGEKIRQGDSAATRLN